MSRVFYNEIDPFCVEWLRALISAGAIPDGVVDSRPIQEIQPEDLREFTQCHLFAGVGGWAYAARLAGWPDDRPLWTGSCPCQPFSLAGKGLGAQDPRHLWPDFFRLIRAERPPVVMGEQTSASAGYSWLDGVGSDLESENYAWRAVDIPACSVNTPHIRNRLYWVGYTSQSGLPLSEREAVLGAGGRHEGRATTESGGALGFWDSYTLIGPDPNGKYRRVKPNVRLLVAGLSGRMGRLRGYGNSIVPQIAAEVIAAWMEQA